MTDEMTTRPTIETVLERIGAFDTKLDNRINVLEQKIDALEQKFDGRIDALERKVDQRFDQVDARFDQVDARFRHVDNELDRISSVAHSTKAELATLRIAFREMREQVKEALPILQES